MNSYGTKFRLSIFGESHGPLIGVVLDGVPAGMPLSREDFLADLDRRRSGAKGSTPRKESDLPEIVSGVCDGHTTGAPLTIVFRQLFLHLVEQVRVCAAKRSNESPSGAFKRQNGLA